MLSFIENIEWDADNKLKSLESVTTLSTAAGNILVVKFPRTGAAQKASLEKWAKQMSKYIGIPVVMIPDDLSLEMLRVEGFDLDAFRRSTKEAEARKDKEREADPRWPKGVVRKKAPEPFDYPREPLKVSDEDLAKLKERYGEKLAEDLGREIDVGAGKEAIDTMLDKLERSGDTPGFLSEDEELTGFEEDHDEVSGRAERTSDHDGHTCSPDGATVGD